MRVMPDRMPTACGIAKDCAVTWQSVQALHEVRAYLQPVSRGVSRKKFVKGLTTDRTSFFNKCRAVIALMEPMSDTQVVKLLASGVVSGFVFHHIPRVLSVILMVEGALSRDMETACVLLLRIVSSCLHNLVRCQVDSGTLSDALLTVVDAVLGRRICDTSRCDVEVWACDIALCASTRHSEAHRARFLVSPMAETASRAMAVPENLLSMLWGDFARKLGVTMCIQEGSFLTTETWAARMMMYATIVCLRQSPLLPQWVLFANRLLALMINNKPPLDALFQRHICELSDKAEHMGDCHTAHHLMKVVVLTLYVDPGAVPVELWMSAISCSRAYMLRDMTSTEAGETQWVTFVAASYMKHHPNDRVGSWILPLCERWLRAAARLRSKDVTWGVCLGYVMDMIGYTTDDGAQEDVRACISLFGTLRKVVCHLRHRNEVDTGEAQLMARLLTPQRMHRLQSVRSSQHRLMIKEVLQCGVMRLWRPLGWRDGTTDQLMCIHSLGMADATAAMHEPARWRELIRQATASARDVVVGAFNMVIDAARGSGTAVPSAWLELLHDVRRHAADPVETRASEPDIVAHVAEVLLTDADAAVFLREAKVSPCLHGAVAVGCWNPTCRCLDQDTEAAMVTRGCGGCRIARYCSARCQRADWRRGHRRVCRGRDAEVVDGCME